MTQLLQASIDHLCALHLMIGDALFGPVLSWSRDATLLLISFITVLMLLLVRRLATRQAVLHATSADLATLRRRIRSSKDADVRLRCRRLRARVARVRLCAELPATLISVVLVVFIVGWSWQRLQFLPPRANQPLTFRALLPSSDVGNVIHLVPQRGLVSSPGRVRLVEVDPGGQSARGRAWWLITFRSEGTYDIAVRCGSTTMRHRVVVGPSVAVHARQSHGSGYVTAIDVYRYQPFGWVPSIRPLHIPPWLIAYSVLVVLGLVTIKKFMPI